MTNRSVLLSKTAADVGAACLLLALCFFGMAESDVAATAGQTFWSVTAVVGLAASLVLTWLHVGFNAAGAVRVGLHWLGVLGAIQLVYVFILAGRFANADAGLANSAIIALGTFLCGVHTTWRLAVIGLALAAGTLIVAIVEEYELVLLVLTIVTIIVLVAGARLLHGRVTPAAPGA